MGRSTLELGQKRVFSHLSRLSAVEYSYSPQLFCDRFRRPRLRQTRVTWHGNCDEPVCPMNIGVKRYKMVSRPRENRVPRIFNAVLCMAAAIGALPKINTTHRIDPLHGGSGDRKRTCPARCSVFKKRDLGRGSVGASVRSDPADCLFMSPFSPDRFDAPLKRPNTVTIHCAKAAC